MPKTFPGLKLGLGVIKRCCRTYLYTSINLINLKQQILSILLALGKSVSFTWMLGSVCVFIKLCACFQALCMFSGSVHVFRLCARFYQALCAFSLFKKYFCFCSASFLISAKPAIPAFGFSPVFLIRISVFLSCISFYWCWLFYPFKESIHCLMCGFFLIFLHTCFELF